MNNSVGGNLTDAGAVAFGGHNNPVPAQFTAGAVGFGPAWQDDATTLQELYDKACQSIVRQQCEIEELRAEVALAEAERIEMAKMLRSEREMHTDCQNERDALQEERDQERLRVRSLNAFASSMVKTIGELKAERVELKSTIEGLRDTLCQYKCHEKSAADGGWANI